MPTEIVLHLPIPYPFGGAPCEGGDKAAPSLDPQAPTPIHFVKLVNHDQPEQLRAPQEKKIIKALHYVHF